jgi:hypothetical protein
VKPCREPRLGELEALVVEHSLALSGCLLVLMDWDEPRRALVRRLKAMRLPTLVMVLVPAGKRRLRSRGRRDQPDRLVVLESGRVGEGLRKLEVSP